MPKTTDLTAATTPLGSGDTFYIVQGGVSKKTTLAALAGTGMVFNVKSYGALGDNSTDDTTAIQAAVDAAGTAGGGVVFFPTGIYLIGAAGIVLKNKVYLKGTSRKASIIKAKNAANYAAMVSNYVSSNGIEANAQSCGLIDIGLNGNFANQSSGTGYGVSWNSNPSFTQATNDETFDNLMVCINVWAEATYGIAFKGNNRSSNFYSACYAYTCGQGGVGFPAFNPAFDSVLIGCVSGGAGKQGFYVTSPSVQLVGCKSFYSGNIAAASGHGFHFDNTSFGILTNCYAQDNRGHGFVMQKVKRTTLTACIAESNSTSSAGTYVGFSLDAGSGSLDNVALHGCISGDRKWDGINNTQTNALEVVRSTGTLGYVDIEIMHSADVGTVGNPIKSIDSTFTGRIKINNEEGFQSPAFAASLTPDPYLGSVLFIGALTAAITINAPTNLHKGSRLHFFFTQDGTGGRTITFNTVFKLAGGSWTPTTTAAARNNIQFIYDGTNWIEVGRAINA